MTLATQQFFLISEPASPSSRPVFLPLPPGVSFLAAPVSRPPRLIDVPPESFDDILILEAHAPPPGQPRLSVLNPASGHLLVNGRSVPRLAILKEKDELILNYGTAFFVAIHRQPRIGPPDPTCLNTPCPVCRVPLDSSTLAYHCHCGCALHCESAAHKPEPLQCLSLTETCPRCRSSLIRSAGYSWLPDFCNV